MTEHSHPPPVNASRKTLANALALGEAGYRVFPCRPHDKAPATAHGLHDATTDEATIRAWFDNDRGFNLAVACGPQPNGINLFAIDVDPKSGGDRTWAELTNTHGVPLAPRHKTPSDGFHLFFDAPAAMRSSRNRIGQGIDHRGEGGYVVVPPSVLVDDEGEIIRYKTDPQTALVVNRPPALPLWVMELLLDPPNPQVALEGSILRHPSSGEFETPLDYIRRTQDWATYLVKYGWVHDRGDYWVRPGKNPRDGHSAVLHPGGPLVVFSTEVPKELESLGTPTVDGTGFSVSLGELIAAYEFGGDLAACASHWRHVMNEAIVGVGGRASFTDPAIDDTPPLYPPSEFYAQRPWMTAVQQMAQAVGGSPAAHLIAFLCRWATLIPPGYSIPAINGAPSSFDLLGVIAGTSGSGKTSAMRNAAEMLPVQRKDLRMGLGLGSGEGVIEAFYGIREVIGDDGKKRRERAKVIAGVHFAVDEGLLLAELNGRAGTTHTTRLCTAWSGGALSTANASQETFRHIEANTYRLTAVLGIQADRAHELMTDSAASQGFVGRLLFAWAEEPRLRPRPEMPEAVTLRVPPIITGAVTYLSYPNEVVTELQDAADARAGQNVAVEDHHHDLMRCKIAGIVALMDERTSVSMDDWLIATTIVDCSARTRLHLYAQRVLRKRDARHAATMERAEAELVVEDVKERRAAARMAEAIRSRVKDAPMSRGKLARAVSASSTRHRFEPALSLAVSNGWVVVADEQVFSLEG